MRKEFEQEVTEITENSCLPTSVNSVSSCYGLGPDPIGASAEELPSDMIIEFEQEQTEGTENSFLHISVSSVISC